MLLTRQYIVIILYSMKNNFLIDYLIIDRFTMGNITSVHVFMIQRKENHILFSYTLLLSIMNYHIKRRFTVKIGIYHSVFKINSFNRKIWQFLFLHATFRIVHVGMALYIYRQIFIIWLINYIKACYKKCKRLWVMSITRTYVHLHHPIHFYYHLDLNHSRQNEYFKSIYDLVP